MSIAYMDNVWKLSIPPHHAWILMALADHADDTGENIFPSIARIAWKTGLSSRQVRRTMSELRECGLIEVYDYKESGTRVYRLNFEKAQKKSPFKSKTTVSEWGDIMSPLTPMTGGDDAHDSPPLSPVTAKPSVKPSVNHQEISPLVEAESEDTPREETPEEWFANHEKPQIKRGKLDADGYREVTQASIGKFEERSKGGGPIVRFSTLFNVDYTKDYANARRAFLEWYKDVSDLDAPEKFHEWWWRSSPSGKMGNPPTTLSAIMKWWGQFVGSQTICIDGGSEKIETIRY